MIVLGARLVNMPATGEPATLRQVPAGIFSVIYVDLAVALPILSYSNLYLIVRDCKALIVLSLTQVVKAPFAS